MFFLFVILILVCAYLFWWYWQQTRPLRLPEQQVRVLGHALPEDVAARTSVIPKLIWTYWHSKEQPVVVQRCLENWQQLNPDYQINMLHADNLQEFLSEVPVGLTRLNVAKQTDWIRLALLQKYGGIWLDASIILTQSLDWVEQIRRQKQAEFVGYYLTLYTTNPEVPVLDSWFLAAPAQSHFIADWLELFSREAIIGETADYIASLTQSQRLVGLRQAIADPHYHTVHIAAQDVLARAARPYRLVLLQAEDSAYALHLAAQWRRKRLYMRLLWTTQDQCPPLVKLRGGERKKLEPYLKHGWCRSRSLAGQLLSGKRKAGAQSKQLR